MEYVAYKGKIYLISYGSPFKMFFSKGFLTLYDQAILLNAELILKYISLNYN